MADHIQAIEHALNTQQPKDVVHAFLLNTSKEHVQHAAEKLVAADATYVSLNFNNPELKQIEPWCGTSKRSRGLRWHLLECRHLLAH